MWVAICCDGWGWTCILGVHSGWTVLVNPLLCEYIIIYWGSLTANKHVFQPINGSDAACGRDHPWHGCLLLKVCCSLWQAASYEQATDFVDANRHCFMGCHEAFRSLWQISCMDLVWTLSDWILTCQLGLSIAMVYAYSWLHALGLFSFRIDNGYHWMVSRC